MAKTWNYQVAGDATFTTTGNIDDLDFSKCAVILMNNASLATIRGLKAGFDGQRINIVSIGAGQVALAHQDTNSLAPNRLINFGTAGNMPLAAGVGNAQFVYDSATARWRMIGIESGWLTPSFVAGDFTGNGAMTWTVASGDVQNDRYRISGPSVLYTYDYQTTTVGGTPNTDLKRALPAAITPGGGGAVVTVNTNKTSDNGTAVTGIAYVVGGTATLFFERSDAANWAASTDNTRVVGSLTWAL